MTHSNNIASLHISPHSIEAEQGVLGGLMIKNEAWDDIADRLNEKCFYRKDHALIFNAIKFLNEKNKPTDVVTLAEILNQHDKLKNAGGLEYLGTLAKDTPSAANIRAYADIVFEKYQLRRMIEIAGRMASRAYQAGEAAASEIMAEAEASIFELTTGADRGGPVRVSNHIPALVLELEARFNRGGGLIGLDTGLQCLNAATSGLQGPDLLILAGRPSMGKTTLAMNIVENVAVRLKKGVLVFSMEMSARQLLSRCIASLGDIAQRRLRNGQLLEHEWPRFTHATGVLGHVPLFIDDSAGLSITQIRTRARRLKRKENIELIVVDYLGLMDMWHENKQFNKTDIVGGNSAGLKNLAKELDVPIICLSQLNRSLESRQNKRPILSDLRDSGSVEQDADIVMFIYRDEIYNEDTNHKGIAELIIAKNRHDSIGTHYLLSEFEKMRFKDYVGDVPKLMSRSTTSRGFE